jgi:hypothetical protein
MQHPRLRPCPHRPEWLLESRDHTTHGSGKRARSYLSSNPSQSSLLKVIVKIRFEADHATDRATNDLNSEIIRKVSS